MKNALVVIDDALQYHQAFIAYIKREIQQYVGSLDTVHFIKKEDGDIVEVLEEVIGEHQNVFIATAENFSFTSKMIATICHDALGVREEILIPMKAEQYSKKSYLITKGKTHINVLHVNPLEKIPPLWIQNRAIVSSFYLFDPREEKEIEGYIRQLEMRFEKIMMIEGMYFYKVYAVHISQQDALIAMMDVYLHTCVLWGDDLSEIISARLIAAKATLTCAESCTGGMLASQIIKNSGISSIFAGSVVTYSNEMKQKLLGVRKSTLQRYGAVSHACVNEMLNGVIEKFDADFAIAVSGVAGPTGGTPQKPVGTVYIGAKCRGFDVKIQRLLLKGDRTYIREQSVLWGFKLLLESHKKLFFKKITKTLDK